VKAKSFELYFRDQIFFRVRAKLLTICTRTSSLFVVFLKLTKICQITPHDPKKVYHFYTQMEKRAMERGKSVWSELLGEKKTENPSSPKVLTHRATLLSKFNQIGSTAKQ